MASLSAPVAAAAAVAATAAAAAAEEGLVLLAQGAEARVYVLAEFVGGRPAIVKERFVKSYRLPELDRKLTGKRVVGVCGCVGCGVGMDAGIVAGRSHPSSREPTEIWRTPQL